MEAAEGQPRCGRGLSSEDYHSNRRVFLRSYPLQWERAEDEEKEQEQVEGSKGDEQATFKRCLKNKFIAVFSWGHGKLLILRRLKKKATLYVVACQPFGFKPSGGRLISLK